MTASDQTAALVQQVADAATQHTALRIRGGDSKAFLGCRFDGELLDTRTHTGIVEYEPNELVITVRSGTKLDEIDEVLDQNGQMLGFEPPGYSPSATIGGTFACNQSGPARPWRGSVRDSVLGVRLINGRGQHLRFGGRVIKNVAGFDASRLQAGAFGSLGVITELSLKVLPQPQSSITLIHELDARTSIRRMNELAGTPAPVTAAAWMSGSQYIRLAGNRASVEAAARQIGGDETDSAVWKNLRNFNSPIFLQNNGQTLWRLSVSATSEKIISDDVIIDWAGALRFVRNNHSLGEMSEAAAESGGHATRLNHNADGTDFMQQPEPAVRALHERLKLAFDPNSIFNPGRLYSWL